MDLTFDDSAWLGELDEKQRDIHRKGERVVRAYTLKGEALSKANAPVRTGHLRGGIHSEFDSTGDTISGTFGPTADYAKFVHNGTSRQAPNPFNDRAFLVVKPGFEAAVAALLAE